MPTIEPKTRNARSDAGLGALLIVIGLLLFGAALSVGAARAVESAAHAVPAPLTPPAVAVAPAATPSPQPVSQKPVPAAPWSAALLPLSPDSQAPPAQPTASPAPTPRTAPGPPATHIAIPAVGVDADVVEVGYDIVEIDGRPVMQWRVADYAAGHAALSANPGEGGNIVLSGHDDWRGEVFRGLHDVGLGDEVFVTTPVATHRYVVTEIHYRQEAGAPLAERLAAAQFIAPMPEERLTLVTCWSYGVDTHRLIVVAKPT